jgi:hypothetical protein
MLFRIEFGKSSSTVFSYALDIAKKASTFQVMGDTLHERYSVTYDQLSSFVELASQVRGWKTTRLMIEERLLSFSEYMGLYQINECHRKKREFVNQRLYCQVDQNGARLIFPCRFIRIYRYEFSEGKYGTIHGDTLALDKDHLKFALEQQIRRTMCYCCPAMDMKRISKFVDELPNQLPIKQDLFWADRIVASFDNPESLSEGETKRLKDLLKDIDGLNEPY